MRLSEYVGKTVRVKTKDGRSYSGYVLCFESCVESESGYDEIGIEQCGWAECVDESEIESIEVIKAA